MKLRINLYVLLLLTLSMACSPKKEGDHEDAEGRTWQAMDDYHMIMAESYHPLKDSANLAPARANAEALAAEAEKWATSEMPKKADNDEMKAHLEAIRSGSRAFADMVKASATDEELKLALTALHDEFHKVMEMWAGGHSDHH